jgi:hypothetical protein
LIPGCCPGGTLGAGVAVTPGVKRLPPVGLTPFSVGVGAGALDGDVVAVVVDVDDGACSPVLLQAVAKPPIAINAAPPAIAITSRLSLTVFTMLVPSVFSCSDERRAARSARAAP